MLKKILIALLAAVAVCVGVVAMQPAEFSVERSITIAAPVSTVFAQVNDQRAWAAWSPWAKLDPNASFTYEGPAAGVGAIARWKGNMEVGEGVSTITKSQADALVEFQLDFIEPMAAANIATFTFIPKDAATTEVRWRMTGNSDFLGKAVALLFDCDKMVGEQFEKGLATLKTVAEAKK